MLSIGQRNLLTINSEMFTFTDTVPLKKFCIEIGTPSVVVLVCVAFGRRFSQESGTLMNGIHVLINELPLSPPCEVTNMNPETWTRVLTP